MPLPVSQDFHNQMKAQSRRIYGKIQVDYTDPFLDQSIQVSTSENANYSYPEQVADNTQEPYGKIASLDGSWVLDGTYVLAPGEDEADEYQMGWWGSQLSDENGNYTAPYPTLAVTFVPRPIRSLQVIADNKRKEWPVNFEINLYSNETLLYTETVTGNTEIFWSTNIERVNEVTKMELIITKWSHANRQVKVLEFFTSIQETYETDDILLINLLEEREVSQGSLPVGNISSNEIDIRLVNENGRFDAGNRQSPLYQLLKQNRRIKAWLGTYIDYDIVPTEFLVDTDAEWNQGTLTDVVAVDGGLELWQPEYYANFDNNVNLTKNDGTTISPESGAIYTLRPGEGRFGGAVAVEEGTTNLVENGDVQTLSKWRVAVDGSAGDSIILTFIENDGVFGDTCAQFYVEKKASWSYFYYRLHDDVPIFDTTKQYTLSFYAKGTGVLKTSVKDGQSLYVVSPAEGFNLTPEWRRYTLTFTPAIQGVNPLVFWELPQGNTVRIDGLQLEVKPYATSFVDGTRSDGLLPYPVSHSDNYTISCYRKAPREDEWKHVAMRSDGKVFVDGVEDSSYNTDWIQIEQGKITFTKDTGLLEELLISPKAHTEEEIARWYEQSLPLQRSERGYRTQRYNLSHISSVKDSVISWNTLHPFRYENNDSFTNLSSEYVFDTKLYLPAGEYQCTFDAYDEESGMEMGLKLENAQHTINVYATTAGGNNSWTSQKETFIVPEDGYYTIKGVNFQSYSYTWGIRNIKITGTTIENISNTSTIIIETNLSLDNGQTWLGWKECTNGGSIPDITTGMDLSNAILDTRQTLSTNDTTVTPQLEQLKITINGIEYFPEPELKYIPLGTFWSGDWTAPEGEIYVQTTGRDRLELLNQSTYSDSQVIQNVTLYDLAIDVLEDYGLEPEDYFVDEELQNTVIPYAYFTPQSHREALRKIAEACLGQCYCDRDGIVRLEGYSYLQSKTEPDITITRDDYFMKDNPYNYMQIANYIEVETQPLRPAPVEEVYRSNEPVSINAGETISITAYYNSEPCIEPVASVEGTGTISEVTYYSWGADVKVTSNTTGEFELVINAKPLRVQGAEKVVAKDDDSIRENGMIKYTFPKNSLVQTRQQAQKIADNLLAYFKDPRRDLTVEWRGNPALLLGDRVRIVDEYGGEDFFVTKQNIEYDGGLKVSMEGRKVE